MGYFNQFLCTAIACNLSLIIGLMFSWPSSTVKLFKSSESILNRPMTAIEISLLGSVSSMSALISIPISGYLNDNLGRKGCCILFAMIQVISRLIVCCCYIVEVVLATVFIAGLSSCLMILVPIYVGEICQESIRGSMTSCSTFFMIIGMLISYVLGGLLQYSALNYVYLSITVLGVLLMNILKESPMFLMKKGREEDAAKSVAYYRGVDVDSKEVSQELEKMRKALSSGFEALSPEEENLQADLKRKKLSLFQFLKKSRSTRRALAVCLFLYTAAIFQGLLVVQVYAQPLFEKAAPNMSATISSVLFAIVCMFGSLIAAFLMDKLGRRPLMIYGSATTCACCVALGTQIHLVWGPQWLTLIFTYMYCLTYLCGAGTVPYVVVAEVFLPEIKSYASMMVMEWGYFCSSAILFLVNPLIAVIGLGPVFYLFAVMCLISAIISAICLPETKGLTVDVIQTKFERQW